MLLVEQFTLLLFVYAAASFLHSALRQSDSWISAVTWSLMPVNEKPGFFINEWKRDVSVEHFKGSCWGYSIFFGQQMSWKDQNELHLLHRQHFFVVCSFTCLITRHFSYTSIVMEKAENDISKTQHIKVSKCFFL